MAETTLSGQISALAQAVGAKCKELQNITGSLTNLTTSDKTNLVAAINELKSAIGANVTSLNSLSSRMTTVEGSASKNASDIVTINSSIGTINATLTELQGAIDDLEDAVASATGIDDTTTSTATTWSSSKINSEIGSAAQAVKNELLDGAGTAYDTLKELGALIETNKDAIEALEALAAGHVQYDKAQTLTDAQKKTARTNIGAASASDLTALTGRVSTVEGKASTNQSSIAALTAAVGDTTADFVAVFNAAME